MKNERDKGCIWKENEKFQKKSVLIFNQTLGERFFFDTFKLLIVQHTELLIMRLVRHRTLINVVSNKFEDVQRPAKNIIA